MKRSERGWSHVHTTTKRKRRYLNSLGGALALQGIHLPFPLSWPCQGSIVVWTMLQTSVKTIPCPEHSRFIQDDSCVAEGLRERGSMQRAPGMSGSFASVLNIMILDNMVPSARPLPLYRRRPSTQTMCAAGITSVHTCSLF